MRKINYYIGLAVITIFTAAGCVKEIAREEGTDKFPVISELTAGFDEGQTKTYVENNVSLKWHESDMISAFVGNTLNSKYAFEGETGDNAGSFSYIESKGADGKPLNNIYAVYPYDESASISENGVISLQFPKVQKYGEDSFGANANTMVAATASVEDTYLSFKNACGFVKIKLYSESEANLKSVTIRGNDNEKIAGAADVTIKHGEVPAVSMAKSATDLIQVLCDKAVKLSNSKENPTEVWVVVPEITFGKGITITVADDNGGVFVKSTSNEIAVTRNEIQPMSALKVEYTQASPRNNEIWYTAPSKVEFYSTLSFIEKVVSNEYDSATQTGIITFDEPISKIGAHAFKNKTALKRVILPEGVIRIENDAFTGCTGLEYLFIPSTATDIDAYVNAGPFTNCTGELVLHANVTKNSAFRTAKFSKVTLGENVSQIAASAFANNTSLVEVTMSNVTLIDGSAFSGCSNLERVDLGNKVEEIASSAFYNCKKLTSIDFPATLNKIGVSAFTYAGLTSIELPEGLESIGMSAFMSNKSLTEVRIPMSVTEYGTFNTSYYVGQVFPYCNGITKFSGKYATEDGRALIDGDSMLEYAAGCTETSYVVPEGVKYIEDALDNCTNLKEITLPTTLKTIPRLGGCKLVTIKSKAKTPPTCNFSPWNPFNDKNSAQILVPVAAVDSYKAASGWSTYKDIIGGYYDDITGVEVSDKKIEYTATEKIEPSKYGGFGATFVYSTYDEATCRGEICFDADITTIPANVFSNKSALTSITIPEGVTQIGASAFKYCTSLETVDLPNTLTKIGESVFAGCKSLTEIVIPSGVTELSNYVFENCTSLEVVDLPTSLITINYMAFAECKSLTEIDIPSGVTQLANYVFMDCTNLKVVKLPSSITKIGYLAFMNDTSLTTVYCDALTPPSISDSFDYTNETFIIYVPVDAVAAYKEKWSALAKQIVGKYSMGNDIPVGYSVSMNADFTGTDGKYGWMRSSSIANPNPDEYDGVFESSNYRKNSSESIMYIDINGLTSFSFYIKTSSESGCDEIVVSQLDMPINRNTSTYNNSVSVKTTASGKIKSGDWSIDGYTKVSFDNIDGGAHRITVIYSKDSSDHEGNDKGYILIPKEYGSNVEEIEPSYTLQLKPSTYGWKISSYYPNPNSSLYDGIYTSLNNGYDNTAAEMYIDIVGYNEFTIYVASYTAGEANYDYVLVSELDKPITDEASAKATTKGMSGSEALIKDVTRYKKVTFENIGGLPHRITVQYKKDGLMTGGDDAGYLIIPKNQK